MANVFEEKGFNPIAGVGTQPNNLIAIKCPSSYGLEDEDLSNKDAGRTEDGAMSKNRIGTITGIKLEWQNITTEEGYEILKAFQPEYVWVEFFDWKLGRYDTRQFYTGNRTSTLYNCEVGRWSKLSFNLIEVRPINVTYY